MYGKVTALGVLCCFALFVCLTLLASFFLPSHLSFKNMYVCVYTAGHKVFRPHALLLRGSLHALWRMDSQALRDLQEVINTQNLPNVVSSGLCYCHWCSALINFFGFDLAS